MSDLVQRLRAMSRYEHDDLTVADEAADEIERLGQQHAQAMTEMDAEIERLRAGMNVLIRERRGAESIREALQSLLRGSPAGAVRDASAAMKETP